MTGTVPQKKEGRKALRDRRAHFKSALALARTTAREWCEVNGVTEGHLYAVLKGDRESASLLARVDAFIDVHHTSQFAKVAQQDGSSAR